MTSASSIRPARMAALAAAAAVLAAPPAAAATGPFFSLANTNFIVLLAFLLFVGILIYFKVPGRIAGMLDSRAAGIRHDLEEARRIREEAQTLLASYERKSRETQDKAGQIVAHARDEAEDAARAAKAEIEASVARRLQSAEEKIASAEAAALREVRDRAAEIAVAAAAEVLRGQMDEGRRNALVDRAIGTVEAKLH